MESARPATATDLPVLTTMIQAATAETRTKRGGARLLEEQTLTPDRLPGLLDDPNSLLLVGEYNSVPLGYAWVTYLGGRGAVARLEHLWVDPEARQVAVGEALMDVVLSAAGAYGCGSVESVALPGDRQTKNFFERYGLTARLIVVARELGPPSAEHDHRDR